MIGNNSLLSKYLCARKVAYEEYNLLCVFRHPLPYSTQKVENKLN